MPDIVLPGMGKVDLEAGPSRDTTAILQALAEISNQLRIISLQNDLMLRMESNETSRSDVKSRIRQADELNQQQQQQQQDEVAHTVDAVTEAS